MKTLGFLILTAFGLTLRVSAEPPQKDELSIGGQVVKSKVINGTIVGDRYIVVSNELVHIHAEVTPIQRPPGAPKEGKDSKPSMQLMLGSGDSVTKPGGVNGLHGLMYMATDWKTPNLGQTNRVDILSTADKTTIVIMVRDNGPIYNSTNSGMTWTVINTPGTHDFPLTSGPDGGGLFARATLYASPESQPSTNSTPREWYAVASAPDGSGLVVAGGSSQSTPPLTIKKSAKVVILSWPAAFTGFKLQQNSGLTTTNWIDVTNPVSVVGEENQVTLSTTTNNFYRLRSAEPR